ncbi:LEAF RUST 10 DISEASE-RESISTANCE LOCUS RECEPTOR-LIKE PROTEIN KINASE-like 2.5 [Neltuma alba]|uniref:LEAF RUST 10 DISEASE-RESISTANCE LOCUS RECEPTOR-LIKE PROTEIN KINASE-like 2.5 n=1 Tax=Neltuma alba TaxID=207710 RepID=UPI0010A53083|nr:LEAF RUST 10 DISEASE-RESISTANCE LOCUS RECEPTOR-LIKE PROTEIN KINASE-like 2.5 [Prosopis alba]
MGHPAFHYLIVQISNTLAILSGDSERPDYCGHPKFELDCDGEYAESPSSLRAIEFLKSTPQPQGTSGSTEKLGSRVSTGISTGVGGLALISILIIYICKKRFRIENGKLFIERRAYHDHNLKSFMRNYVSLAPRQYSYSEVKRMTKSFSDKLGEGGYGVVYKASLPDGRLAAVKVIRESKGSGEEFINEVASISRTSHVNIVTLLGFCYERNKRVLIYEFLSHGSLDNFIYHRGSPNAFCTLEWKVLYQVAIGIARGLEYLHRGCNTRILHLDIKPQNILLDEEFSPKISDFGLAKLCQKKENTVSILGTRGTIGFIAPEIFSRAFGGVSHKADVYSYGMLVLEMVGGRKNYDSGGSQTDEQYFPDWIYKDLEHGKHPASSLVITEEDDEVVRKMTLVSLWCVQTNPSDRPAMSKVVEMLEGPLQSLTVPPKPSLEYPTKSSVVIQLSNASSEDVIQTVSISS